MLAFTRKCLELRRSHRALTDGAMTIIRADDQLLTFERKRPGETLRCTFNLSDQPCRLTASGRPIFKSGDFDGKVLAPYASVIEEIS